MIPKLGESGRITQTTILAVIIVGIVAYLGYGYYQQRTVAGENKFVGGPGGTNNSGGSNNTGGGGNGAGNNTGGVTGSTRVHVGYVLADGREIEFSSSSDVSFYIDPLTTAWYTDSGMSQKITALWGKLEVEPKTTNSTISSVIISWARVGIVQSSTINATVGTGSGTAEVPVNVATMIEGSKYTTTLPSLAFGGQSGAYSFTWKYSLSVNAGPEVTVQNTISVYGTTHGLSVVIG